MIECKRSHGQTIASMAWEINARGQFLVLDTLAIRRAKSED